MTQNDTIVAIATPPGKGGVGIVRVSGPGSKQVLETWFRPITGSIEPRRAVYGEVIGDTGDRLDTGLGIFFVSPHSYTGEDAAEFQLHGSPYVLRELVNRIVEAGMARLAMPGEFTRRAFENGRLDLTDAEQIRMIMEAETRYQLRVAASGSGPLQELVEKLRSDVIRASAVIEARIEYPDETETADGLDLAKTLLRGTMESLKRLLKQYEQTAYFRKGIRVVLVGRPNAGKSTLFNRILGIERAIVDPHPGTTRDTVEAVIDVQGVRVELVDTAGLRETEDAVEGEGVRRSRQEIERADVVVLVLDGCDSTDEQRALLANRNRPHILEVVNKIDLLPAHGGDLLCVSALSGQGVTELMDAIRNMAGDWSDEDLSLFTDRQFRSARDALTRLSEAIEALDTGADDLASAELVSVTRALESIVGLVVTDDVLDAIFGEFCLGK